MVKQETSRKNKRKIKRLTVWEVRINTLEEQAMKKIKYKNIIVLPQHFGCTRFTIT